MSFIQLFVFPQVGFGRHQALRFLREITNTVPAMAMSTPPTMENRVVPMPPVWGDQAVGKLNMSNIRAFVYLVRDYNRNLGVTAHIAFRRFGFFQVVGTGLQALCKGNTVRTGSQGYFGSLNHIFFGILLIQLEFSVCQRGMCRLVMFKDFDLIGIDNDIIRFRMAARIRNVSSVVIIACNGIFVQGRIVRDRNSSHAEIGFFNNSVIVHSCQINGNFKRAVRHRARYLQYSTYQQLAAHYYPNKRSNILSG